MDQFQQILLKHWGYPEFRPLQLEIIQSVADGKDTLGLMPTGGGKSITFQVYSLSTEGMCLVVTPLIALMKDQVENLNRKGIKALAVHSGMSAGEIKLTLDNAVWGDYKFLYISPERLSSQNFQERLVQMNINLVTIDEAHCISQWGYDFRPSYLKIIQLREFLPNVKFLALTATATKKVTEDIQDKLGFKEKNALKMSFLRENLSYLVRDVEDKMGYMLRTIQRVKGSGVIYVRNRKATKEIALELQKNGIKADYYHAGLSGSIRNKKQDDWLAGNCRVIVATNAFGMGIDKPDVRFVIHVQAPDSLEAYYQEAGRAGRDGKKAAAVLLYNNSDTLRLKKQVSTAFPETTQIKRIYDAICNYLQVPQGHGKGRVVEFHLQSFAQAFRFQQSMVYHALKILQREGYLEFTEEVDSPSRIYFMISRDELYKFQVANAAYDAFVKLLLRSYTGLFTGYVAVDEELLAKRAGINGETTYNYLKHLRKSKVIDYVPRSRAPYIYFVKERMPVDRIKISRENYHLRKKEMNERVESVIRYAQHGTLCRSQILLEYFDEKDSPACGICDVCQSLEKMRLSTFEFESISKEVEKLLSTPLSYENLLLKIKGDQSKKREIIQWLLDNNKISYRVDDLLEWSEN